MAVVRPVGVGISGFSQFDSTTGSMTILPDCDVLFSTGIPYGKLSRKEITGMEAGIAADKPVIFS